MIDFFEDAKQRYGINVIIQELLNLLKEISKPNNSNSLFENLDKKNDFFNSLLNGPLKTFSWLQLFLFHVDATGLKLLMSEDNAIDFNKSSEAFIKCKPFVFLAYRILNKPDFDEIVK